MGLFNKIGEGLRKTRESLMGTVGNMLHAFTRIDEELFEELEEILIAGDVGVANIFKLRAEVLLEQKV